MKECTMELISESRLLNDEFLLLKFNWAGVVPKAGQFFMLRPENTNVFLGRPVSVAGWDHFERVVSFLIQLRGPGTKELGKLKTGDRAQLTGPLGNGWFDIARPPRKIALVSGGVGIAPLLAFAKELNSAEFAFFSGFRTLPLNDRGRFFLEGALPENVEPLLATDDGSAGKRGTVLDLVDPGDYEALYVCGSLPLLKAAAAKCRDAHIRCYVSMERRMACGVGACMGCTIHTIHGNQRCCADGPCFNAEEILFG
jgi:NAD(P)H-flavin reductase